MRGLGEENLAGQKLGTALIERFSRVSPVTEGFIGTTGENTGGLHNSLNGQA
jgi:hypothetical protein